MKKFIYKVIFERQILIKDTDRCPYWSDDVITTEFFATKIDAVRFAQKRFAKIFFNDYIRCWYIQVTRYELTRKGTRHHQRVYSKYKANNTNTIY